MLNNMNWPTNTLIMHLNYARENGMNDFYQINAQKARGLVDSTIENDASVEEAFIK